MQGVTCHSDGIYGVDAVYGGQPRLAAVHFVIDHGRVAVIDTGSNASVPHVLAALGGLGIDPDAVDWVILTHLHLDHAGGAGSLMCALPRARLAVHSKSVRHLTNPVRLWEKAVTVFGVGQAFRLYGRLVPIDERRITPTRDGMELPLGDRVLRVLDAPGHACHHTVVWDEYAHVFFTGDAFGVSYREFDVCDRAFVFPTTSPAQFDPVMMMDSINRMVSYGPQAMYLTHYGRVSGVERLAADLFRLIHAQVAVAQAARGEGLVRYVEILAGLEELVREECARQRWALSEEVSLNLLRLDLSLNAHGLESWLDYTAEREAMEVLGALEAELEVAVA
ncbi:MAG: MBL fold metallo-hydrolase [Azoarcus sp.]|jgi:hydroxyacylglutathione hydrolase|nr:MBL fold metallo-hydrolase [Azoarcus sp.]